MLIRPAVHSDAAAMAKVSVDSWKSTYRGIVPDAYLDGLTYDIRTGQWENQLKRGHLIYVAQNETGEIVGYASGGIERSGHAVFKGELYALYLLKAYQRQGIGRQLVLTIMRGLIGMGLNTMLIWVLEENQAMFFYERIGGKRLYNQSIEIGGASLQEVAYGWDDIKAALEFE